MTELEYLARNRDINSNDCICEIAHVCKYNKDCWGKECAKCEFNENIQLCLEILLAEHKDKKKLKKWEYDLLNSHIESLETTDVFIFKDYPVLQIMKKIGYFTGVNDEDMTLEEILENCEVE